MRQNRMIPNNKKGGAPPFFAIIAKSGSLFPYQDASIYGNDVAFVGQ